MESLVSVKTQSWLVWFLRGLLIVGFLVLFARLVDLQVIRGGYFKALAEGNRIRRVPIVAARGEIRARGGEQLASNEEIKRAVIFDEAGFEKIETKSDSENNITEWLRVYPEGSDFGHLSGYLGEVNEEELGKIAGECPEKGPKRLQTWTGRTGLEKQYDCILTGYDGEELIEVNSANKKIRTLGRKNSVKGNDIITTIDFGLQKKIAEIFKDKKGSVVVTDANGEVLALYSSPSYDPNRFVKDRNFANTVLENKELPLFNRSISGIFHPGSVFKPVVAIAGLEEGKIDEDYTYNDTGQIAINTAYGNFSYKNWYFIQYGGTEGSIKLDKAIARSTDTFFYNLGELLGIENIDRWAEKFGLGKNTGIDIPGEVAGLIPSPLWKQNVKGERWFLGNTYHVSIGQGDLAVTPIAVNQAISVIANGGRYCQPSLVSSGNSGKEKCRELDIKKENIDLVKKGMTAACSSGGTGYTFYDFKEKSGKDVSCKTGTAQNEKGEPHAWFTVYAPVEEPELIATILVENGGEGSKVAGPIARDIFNYWFKVPAATPSATITIPPVYE